MRAVLTALLISLCYDLYSTIYCSSRFNSNQLVPRFRFEAGRRSYFGSIYARQWCAHCSFMEKIEKPKLLQSSLVLTIIIYLTFRMIWVEWERFLFPLGKIQEFLAQSLPTEQVDKTIEIKEWISSFRYIIVPFTSLLGALLLSGFSIFLCLFGELKKLTFRQHLLVVLQAQIVASIYFAIRLSWVTVLERDMSFEKWQYFYPGSYLAFVGPQAVDPWWLFSLSQLNFGNLIFLGALAILYHREGKTGFSKSFNFVALGWGGGLFFFLALVTFVQMMLMN